MSTVHSACCFIATLCSALFTGASIYINLVEHPARLECGTEIAVMEFARSYRRAAVLQGSLAILAFLASTTVWFTGGSFGWLIGGLLLVSVVPFTLLVIFPTNKKLLDPKLDKKSDRAARLLHRWGRLHAVRSLLSLVALSLFLSLMTDVG
jgi:Domain of unknown function (DUF1772)